MIPLIGHWYKQFIIFLYLIDFHVELFEIPIEKDLGFLRIGSLNVRVKKTTEAFSNFLGVGGSNSLQYGSHVNHRVLHARGSVPMTSFDMIHKTWGSADNIPPVIH